MYTTILYLNIRINWRQFLTSQLSLSRAHLEESSIATRAFYRTVLMRGFHILVMLLCTQNIKDTQCGFKLFTRKSAQILFKSLHLERWAFDIELIYLAESLGIPLTEVSTELIGPQFSTFVYVVNL